MTSQLVTRVGDDLVRQVDTLVAEGIVDSRSDAVRQALEAFVEAHRRHAAGQAIAAGYRRVPQTAEEVGWAESFARKMIEEEPW